MKQHIKTVKEFNVWRKGGEMTCDEGYPKRLGEALDEVVKAAERYELLRKTIDEIKDEVADSLPADDARTVTGAESLAHSVYLIAMRANEPLK
jgi:hypothetical protein